MTENFLVVLHQNNFSGAVELFEWCDTVARVPRMVVTNAPRFDCNFTLTMLGLREVFGEDKVVLGEECVAGKPDPAPYLEALRKLGVQARQEVFSRSF